MRQQFPGLATISREFTVPAGQTRETWVFVPIAEPSTNVGSVVAGAPSGAAPGVPPSVRTLKGGRGLSSGLPSNVTVTQTPVGTKVSTTRGSGPAAFTLEQEIDATTGAMTTSYIMPPGRSVPPPFTGAPVQPGTEMTFTIDQTFGNIRTTPRRLPDRTAPPRIIIITTPQAGSVAGATIVSSSGPLAVPVVVGGTSYPSMLTVEFAGPGITNSNRLTFSSPPNTQMRGFAVSGSLEPAVRSQLGSVVRGSPNLSAVDPRNCRPTGACGRRSRRCCLRRTSSLRSTRAGARRCGLGGIGRTALAFADATGR